MRKVLIVALVFLTACVSEPLPDGFKASDDFDLVIAAKNRISLGLTYLQNGDFSQAKYNLDKALQFAPRLADAHYSMAYYYQQVDEKELADAAYQKAIDFAPRNADIANSYGAFLCENGDYKRAKKYFLKAVNSSNYISTAETYENLALCSQSQGELEDAVNYLQSAINHQPSRGKSLMLLVELQMQQQQWQQAKLNLRRYEKIARVTPETLWRSVEIETALNNIELAQGYGDMLIRMYPTHPKTLQYINNKRDVSGVDASGKISRHLKPATEIVPVAAIPDPQPADEQASLSSTTNQQATSTQMAESEQEEPSVAIRETSEAEATPSTKAINAQVQAPVNEQVAKHQLSNKKTGLDTKLDATSGSEESPENTANPRYHVVQKGENLYRISLIYNVRMQRLMEWNDLRADTAIVAGKRLIVIDPATVE
jgi:type IV pilus assembly protein PilF